MCSIVRPSIDQASNLATSIENESVERLFEEITTALTEGAFEKVIETVGQAFTARSTNWSRVPEPLIALAFIHKALAHEQLSDYAAAVESYDEVIARFGDSDAPDLQERVAWVLCKKGDVQGRLGELEAALSAYDEAVARLGDSDAPDHQAPVAWTLFKKGIRQINMGRAKEALHTCEEIERRLGALTGNEKIEFTWRVRSMRVMVLMVQKKRRAAVDAFRSAYAVFVPDNETIMNEMLHFVPELIAQGFSERDLVEILSSDREKSDALVPLIVALLQRAGEVVRAPVEVLEVAKDINKDIEARMAN